MAGKTILFIASISALNIGDAQHIRGAQHSSFVDMQAGRAHKTSVNGHRILSDNSFRLRLDLRKTPEIAAHHNTSNAYYDTRPRGRYSRSLASGGLIITQHFTERTVTPGGDISMQCAASGDRPPQFTWERDGQIISSNTDPRYAIGQLMTSDNSVEAQLNITRVRVEDGGLYSCFAREGSSTLSHENRLDVWGPPYIRTLPPIKVQSGESVNLRCPYYGYPISKIEWETNGKTINPNSFQLRYKRNHNKIKIRREAIEDMYGVLTISEVTKEEHNTAYTCIVTSPSGEMARRTFEIQVIEAPVLEDLLLGNNLQEGQIVNIYCNVRSGDLPIHFEWLKDGKRISSSLKVIERNSDLFSALIIKKVGLEHCGTYTCVASNHVAKVNRTTELYIKVAPKWLVEPSNSSLLLGRNGAVTCSASGYPQPQVHWMKKDALLGTWQPVLELAGGGVLSLPNGTLLIEEVSLADEGLYSCNVENGVGQPLSKTVWMSVNKPVHFEAPSVNMTSRLGAATELECRPLGDEPIRITWTHNGIPLDVRSQRTKLSESKSGQRLTSTVSLQYSETSDAGMYQCRANNPYGTAVFSIHLTILEPPAAPSEVRVSEVRARSVVLRWRAARGAVRHYALQYAPRSPHHYGALWDHALTLNVTKQEDAPYQSAELAGLRPATPYEARVRTANPAGASAYTAPVHFVTAEEAPSAAPSGVQASATTRPGELRAAWLPPPRDALHGALLGYRVRARPHTHAPESSDTTVTVKLAGTGAELNAGTGAGGRQEALLSGLLKNTKYAVSVAAFNSAGTGPYSLPVYQDTREGAPELAPSSVECTAISSTSLRVGWQPLPHNQGSSVAGYTVLYAAEDGPWQNQSSPHAELYLTALGKAANYTVKVRAYSGYGAGPDSYPIVCATQEDVPGPPADIKVLVLSSTSLLVSWKRPDHPNGEITHYTVHVKPSSGNESPTSHHVEAARTTLEVSALAVGRSYEVAVTAHTRAGAGPPSAGRAAAPSHRVPPGVASLGGLVSAGAGSSVLLQCQCVGVPAPRTVWYHQHNIITHHPRFTRNHDDSLLINNIDQSLGGNYTCLAKSIYGSDSVQYRVLVLPLPEPPVLRATPYRDSILVEWEQPYYSGNDSAAQKISYSLTWKEANGAWQEAWPAARAAGTAGPAGGGARRHLLTSLQCGTKYSLRITATNRVGTSQPAYLDVSTLGGPPIAPTSTQWLWSNSSHLLVELAGWEDGGCALRGFRLQVAELAGGSWRSLPYVPAYPEQAWEPYGERARGAAAVPGLRAGAWYRLRVTASNAAGAATATYTYATKNEDGSTVGPPAAPWDVNTLVIAASSLLLVACLAAALVLLLRRRRGDHLPEYRDSIALDNKSESGHLTAATSQSNLGGHKEVLQNRVYSAPVHHVRNNSKHELYEISPYAQFAVGFRTFGHVDNQDVPALPTGPLAPLGPPPGRLARAAHRYDTETSFQVCSESEDSDSISKSTLKSVPRKVCRTPHHR